MGIGSISGNITTPRAFKGAVFYDDYVDIAHHDSQLGVNLSKGFTISAWIKPKTTGTADKGRIIDKSSADLGVDGFVWRVGGGNTLKFIINNGTGRDTANVFLNIWSHVLCTISSASYFDSYVNGVKSGGSGSLVQAISTITTTNAIRIGNRAGDTDFPFDGMIKDLKMWNRVLSANEITKDYQGINISEGQILNVPLQDDYNDIAEYKLTGTNSGTTIKLIDDNVSAVLSGSLAVSTISGSFLMCDLAGGQVFTAGIEEIG